MPRYDQAAPPDWGRSGAAGRLVERGRWNAGETHGH